MIAYSPTFRSEAVALAQRIGAKPAARQLGISTFTIYRWLNPAIAECGRRTSREAKRRRTGKCLDCGTTTHYQGHGQKASDRCLTCAVEANRIWTRERIIDAMRDFADQYGRPPSATDWNPPQAIKMGDPERAQRFHDDGCWPYQHSVRLAFGGWNAAIAAAGFEPLAPGQKRR